MLQTDFLNKQQTSLTCEGTGDSTQHNFFTAAYRSSLEVGNIHTTH